MALRIDDISINTILGHGSAITGNIKINGFVRIDGDIDGNLETDGNIIIGEIDINVYECQSPTLSYSDAIKPLLNF